MNIKTLKRTKKVRQIVISIVLILIVITLLNIDKKESLPDVTFDGVTNTEELQNEVKKTFSLLPECYQKKILLNDWKIVITKEDVTEIYRKYKHSEELNDVSSVTILKERTIYMEEGSMENLLHELCHAALYNEETEKSYYIKCDNYLEEAEKLYDDSYYLNYDEYIVDSMANYLKDETFLSDSPNTRKTVEMMLSSTEWIEENAKDN